MRSKEADGQVGPWQEIPLYEVRSLLHLFWNPSKQRQKCVTDCVTALLREATAADTTIFNLQLSWPYIKLAQFAFSEVCGKGQLRQFAIFDTEGIEERKLRAVFVSRWHTDHAA